ncbi:ATP-grasp domain-containing protein [Listeria kieliensis]|uniref:ATP-grasp domain-containing protein n=1 Tax=Listeria kieliensis TaxID=1621700 RepID=A0A3D8TRG9_9LIST|nr:ATP-grasp domain-containing protein [Listeria kieliensis]RDX01323.1 hypothetical protein UR08_10415 [Listeria kieliensis]
MKNSIKLIIYAYPPGSIGLDPNNLGESTFIIVPLAMKEYYINYNQDKVIYDQYFNYNSIISIIQQLLSMYIVSEFIVLSEPDIEFGGLLNDYYGMDKAAQGLTNATLYRNKYYMRSLLKDKVNQPDFYLVKNKKMIYEIFEKKEDRMVLKPLSKDSAQGIKFIENKDEIEYMEMEEEAYLLEQVVEYKTMFTTDGICKGPDIVEFFVHQYDEPILETFQKSKRHITRTRDLYLEERIQKTLFENTVTILKTFNKCDEVFPFHMEWFLKGDSVIFCEAACRFGGKIGSLIQEAYDFNIFDKYWSIKLNKKDASPICFREIRKPNKIALNYCAYKKNGVLRFIPDFKDCGLKLKVEINQAYVASSNIQESSFEVNKTCDSESDYTCLIKRLDNLSASFIYEQ